MCKEKLPPPFDFCVKLFWRWLHVRPQNNAQLVRLMCSAVERNMIARSVGKCYTFQC